MDVEKEKLFMKSLIILMKKMIQYIHIYKFFSDHVFGRIKVKFHVNCKIYSNNLILDDYDFVINKKNLVALDENTNLMYEIIDLTK